MRRSISSRVAEMLEELTLNLSDYIISEIEVISHERKRRAKYKNKILPFGARFVDTSLFVLKKDILERKIMVGYVGRLNKEKGVMSFVEAIPLIESQFNDVCYFVGGDGPSFEKIEKIVQNYSCSKFILKRWIPHNEIPDYLNELKLLLLPSIEEGLPTIVLEAMACGTPVLATPVGAIPELIEDGKTGFILENNSHECIAKNILRALKNPNLKEISNNAKKLINEKYTYEAAIERYKKMLAIINHHIFEGT